MGRKKRKRTGTKRGVYKHMIRSKKPMVPEEKEVRRKISEAQREASKRANETAKVK